jgi:hypothetical protein
MIKIKQNFEEYTLNYVEDRWGQRLPGETIVKPIAGFIEDDFWDVIQNYQNIKMNGDCFLNIEEAEKFKNNKFTSTIMEFNILNEENQLRRTFAQLGKIVWIKIK